MRSKNSCAKIIVDENILKAAVYGGAVLGGGGGGKIEDGLMRGNLALQRGKIEIIDIDALDPSLMILTVSSVGSPASKSRYIEPDYYVRSVQLFIDSTKEAVGGLITNENGAAASVNGWIQSATLGIPVVDAPCNGRAHPTGAMGSMGLDTVDNYISCQAVVGGCPSRHTFMELMVKGNLKGAAEIVSKAADLAGGVVAVARNPVSASYVKKNGAPGGLSSAINVGQKILENWGDPQKMINATALTLGGKLIMPGKIESTRIKTKGALDIGFVSIKCDSGEYEISVINEYMTLEKQGHRIATFPDLIAIFNLETGLPICSANLMDNQKVAILVVDRAKLILGKGMFIPELYMPLENYVDKNIAKYVFEEVC